MNRFILLFVTTSALIFGVFLPKDVAAQTTGKDLVGTWTLVSVTLEQDGKKTDLLVPIRKVRSHSTLTAAFR
jgi:hypothetical protein